MIAPIRQQLSSLATSVLSGPTIATRGEAPIDILGSSPLMPFFSSGMGNFPYYYMDPANLLFNVLTYNWINTNLANNVAPIMQGSGLFSNYFLSAISKIIYSLSSTDQAALNAAQANSINQQGALLLQWRTVFGSIPVASGGIQSIDQVIHIICTDWATVPTDLATLQSAPDISTLLDKTPANAQSIIPYLAAYIKAIDGAATLMSVTSMNNSYLRQALSALQRPSAINGGIVANNQSIYPAYEVTTPLQDIITGLANGGNNIVIDIIITPLSNGQVTVDIEGTENFDAMADDLLSIVLDDDPNYFSTIIAGANSPMHLLLTFNGVTLVNFAPATFDMTSGKNWYWPEVILNAVENGTKNVTGFKFSPNPGIDFSDKGPFGFITAMAISNLPTIQFTVDNMDSSTIQAKVQRSSTVKISLLNTPIDIPDGGINVTSSATAGQDRDLQATQSSIVIDPAPMFTNATPAIDATAWVHGVQTVFPVASAF
ncbi:MAG: hypothetical protein WC756_05210 [Taibaiella sp.]|jgi:hypothetical protein